MRKSSPIVLSASLFALAVSAGAQQQSPHYVYDGKTLQVVNEDLALAKCERWQIWLYQEGVRIPRYTAGLQYSRWGLIEGNSVEDVISQLQDSQSFEGAYLKFFGPGTWGQYTFFNPIGPIALTDRDSEDQPAALEQLYQLRWLHARVDKLIRAVTPSLENNQSQGPASPVEGYFDQIKDALQRVNKLHSQLSRALPQRRFSEIGIVQARTLVAQAENGVPKITAVLPSVKLPTSNAWMSHAERAGSDGTVQVDVVETGSGISVQKAWTGGDGSMTGTVIVTIIPFNDIGSVDFEPPMGKVGDTWTVRVRSAHTSFSETMNSPLRKTAKKVLPAVNLTSTRSTVYFDFLNSAEARDAYAYFLHHKQLGR